MKKFLKRTFIVIGSLLLLALVIGGVYAALNWSEVRVYFGTAGISGTQSGIPQPVDAVPPAVSGDHDWPAWRGSDNEGRSTGTGIRTDWSGGLKKLWTVDYLCQRAATASWSAPVIRGNRLIVPGRDETHDLLFALDPTTGDLLWESSYEAPADTGHGPGPRATPFIDDDRVYTFGRSGDLACWSIEDGAVIWHENVTDAGGIAPEWGHSSSPMVYGDLVIVQAGGTARTIAYDKMSGDVVWKSGEGVAGYAPFVFVETGAEPQLIVFHGRGLAGLDPADGRILWDLPWEAPYDINATTPVVDGDRIFITSGNKRGCQLVQVTATGADVLWTNTNLAALHSDPYIIDGAIYGYSGESAQNKGSFRSIDLETGELNWTTDDIGWGTTTWIDGRLLTMDIRGNLALIDPDPESFRLVTGFDKAFGKISGPVWTVPVIAGGKLYLRFKQHLVCYDLME